MTKPRLHLDEDTSDPRIEQELLKRGHDVTKTPNSWVSKEAKDEEQLKKAGEKGRSIFSYNIGDFIRIAKKTPKHKGIIISHQISISRIIKALDRFFKESSTEEMENQVRWLSDWEEKSGDKK